MKTVTKILKNVYSNSVTPNVHVHDDRAASLNMH